MSPEITTFNIAYIIEPGTEFIITKWFWSLNKYLEQSNLNKVH